MKILWILLFAYGSKLAQCGSLRGPGSKPNIVEQQAKFFQDFFSVQLSPYKIEFGHVCEDPNSWEQRYEKKDYKNHRDMGKVRWGDKKGGYGEHYWDLNHAGHTDNHDNEYDNNPFEEESDTDTEFSEKNENYDTPKKETVYESERNQRSNGKQLPERVKQLQIQENHDVEDDTKNDNIKNQNEESSHRREEILDTKPDEQREKNHIVLVVKHKERKPVHNLKQFVPYIDGSGIRHPPPYTVMDVNHRLFIEPSTGHVIDRATGKAYILQPVV